jgi:hypothetical protein
LRNFLNKLSYYEKWYPFFAEKEGGPWRHNGRIGKSQTLILAKFAA